MSPRRKTTAHYGQLAAAVATYMALTIALTVVGVRADGPEAHTYVPLLGAVLTVWVFAAVWVSIALTLSARATWRAMRTPAPHRPMPGEGRDISWTDREWEAAEAAFAAWDVEHAEHAEQGPPAPRHAGPTRTAEQAADTGPEEWLGRVEHWAQQAAEDATDEAEQYARRAA